MGIFKDKQREIEKRTITSELKRKTLFDDLRSKEAKLRECEDKLLEFSECFTSTEDIDRFDEINEVLECILNSDENDVIDDSYFEFDNTQLTRIEIEVNNKKNGIRILETCGNLPVEVPIDVLMDVNKNLTASTITTGTTSPQEEQVRAMTNAIDTIADTQASGAASIDIPTVKLNFLIDLIKNFMKSIINILISPKLMTLFSLNFKILYGIASEYDGPIDFMKKNKNLIISIAKSVLEPIIKMLLSMVLKRLTAMISKKLSGDKIEQAKNYVAQLLSMLGIPQNIIRQIQGLI
jgi:hypothetical protein